MFLRQAVTKITIALRLMLWPAVNFATDESQPNPQNFLPASNAFPNGKYSSIVVTRGGSLYAASGAVDSMDMEVR